jgi:hypothetical protein
MTPDFIPFEELSREQITRQAEIVVTQHPYAMALLCGGIFIFLLILLILEIHQARKYKREQERLYRAWCEHQQRVYNPTPNPEPFLRRPH